MPKVLTIAGSDSGGGAGIQADLKTFTVLDCYGLSVITALTAQNTLGVQAVHEPPPDFIGRQLDSVLADIGADAAKTGMLATPETVRVVAAKIKEYQVPNLVVDPVMAAQSGDPLVTRDTREALVKELFPLAELITPNLPEMELLLERKIGSPHELAEAARALHDLASRAVLAKGGHLGGPALDILFDGREIKEFTADRLDTPHTHGTGCTYSAAIAAHLAHGRPLAEAVAQAKAFITEAIRLAYPLGRGAGPTNHLALLEKSTVLTELAETLTLLTKADAGPLVPEVQMNLGFALTGAQGPRDVAAFPGRIVRLGSKTAALAGPAFGASRHIARIILTAMRFDPRIRSAMNVKFEEKFLKKAEDLGLEVEGFDRSLEPADVKAREGSSLEWGTQTVIDRLGRVPDLIYDRGDLGKEPMIRILGPHPRAVAAKALGLLD